MFGTGPVNTPWVTQFDWLSDLRDPVHTPPDDRTGEEARPRHGRVAADLIRHGKTSLPIAHLDPGRYLT